MTASQGPERLKQRYDICVIGVLEIEEKENGAENVLKEANGWLFWKFGEGCIYRFKLSEAKTEIYTKTHHHQISES